MKKGVAKVRTTARKIGAAVTKAAKGAAKKRAEENGETGGEEKQGPDLRPTSRPLREHAAARDACAAAFCCDVHVVPGTRILEEGVNDGSRAWAFPGHRLRVKTPSESRCS